MDVVARIRAYMVEELGVAGAEDVAPDLPLVQKGVIDSLELMQVVEFLERTFDFQVDDTEIVPGNFRSLQAMAAFVERKRAAA